MSADRLREAAKVLRERAEAATPGPWEIQQGTPTMGGGTWTLRTAGQPGIRLGVHEYQHGPGNADYIATVHPGVGLALADWLDYEASIVSGWIPESRSRAIVLADLILGGAS